MKICNFDDATKSVSPAILSRNVGTILYMAPEMLSNATYTSKVIPFTRQTKNDVIRTALNLASF